MRLDVDLDILNLLGFAMRADALLISDTLTRVYSSLKEDVPMRIYYIF